MAVAKKGIAKHCCQFGFWKCFLHIKGMKFQSNWIRFILYLSSFLFLNEVLLHGWFAFCFYDIRELHWIHVAERRIFGFLMKIEIGTKKDIYIWALTIWQVVHQNFMPWLLSDGPNYWWWHRLHFRCFFLFLLLVFFLPYSQCTCLFLYQK